MQLINPQNSDKNFDTDRIFTHSSGNYIIYWLKSEDKALTIPQLMLFNETILLQIKKLNR